jgi:hypothetical protein
MANPIQVKRRASGAAGAPAALKSGELAYNMVDSVLYIGHGDDGSGNATSILVIGGVGGAVLLSGNQSIDGVKTFTSSPLLPTPSSSDNSTKAATTAFVKAQGYLVANAAITGATKTKITYDANGLVTAGADLTAGDIPALTSAKISDFDTQVRASRLDQMAAPTADVSLDGHKLTNVTDPSNPQDAATKAYVDAHAAGVDPKESVRLATAAALPTNTRSGNVLTASANGALTVDGTAVAVNDPVLVKDESSGLKNGIYTVTATGDASNPWVLTRRADADTSAKVTSGLFVFVTEGSANDNSGWTLTTNDPITLNSTALSFVQFSGAGQIVAGAGLTKTGNTLDVVGTAARIVVNADSIDIDAGYVGQTSITTLGTIATGTWQGTVIAGAYGGLGAALSTITDGALLKRSGTAVVTATVGTDYLSNASTIDGGTF